MARFLPLLICAAMLPACAGDEPPARATAERDKALPSRQALIPAQRRDPEQVKGDSASVGASLPGRIEASAPHGVTDLGREAEREEEEFRKRQKLPELQK